MRLAKFCPQCGRPLNQDGPEDDGEEITAAINLRSKERVKGYIEIIHSREKEEGDITRGKSQFIIYDTFGKKWVKKIGKTSTKRQVLYEGLISFLDAARSSTQIDLFTSDKDAANRIHRKAGLPADKNQAQLCSLLRQFLPRFRGITLNYIPESVLQTAIRPSKYKAIIRRNPDY